jgi:hypothetical protein
MKNATSISQLQLMQPQGRSLAAKLLAPARASGFAAAKALGAELLSALCQTTS